MDGDNFTGNSRAPISSYALPALEDVRVLADFVLCNPDDMAAPGALAELCRLAESLVAQDT